MGGSSSIPFLFKVNKIHFIMSVPSSSRPEHKQQSSKITVGRNSSFYEKALAWQSTLDDELALLRISKNNDAITECTFWPNTSPTFTGNDLDNNCSSKNKLNEKKRYEEKRRESNGERVAERCEELYQEALSRNRLIDQMHQMEKERRIEAEMHECTFQPLSFGQKKDKENSENNDGNRDAKGELE